ncbi:hypothetical protein [Vitiosangium sp. GDMCC 1.1324]|uniref:hypothetical protein n=1 Tax=Vitiosangium sp. (strain GDMCC 1.1324) TaxID=2138576 RepID=UPI000D3BA611|nr:hypothetical protein [Vitiosangium sp. GDMCC 1.1324]PTL78987.1 hypothetical protein DAT35_35790 [Vitiosangium sp. GDMCC 1.1324]
MTRRILGLALATVFTASCDSTQPPIGCPVQSLEWAAVYKLKEPTSCPVKAGEPLGIQKFSTPSGDETLTISPQTLVDLSARDTTHVAYSRGTLAKQSDADGFCSVSDLAPAEKRVPDDATGPGTNVLYRWSNVRILATARAPGTQMVADLEYTQDGCTAHYEVWGMWPGDISCEGESGKADDSLCASAGTINPDFAVTCEPTLLRCVPAQRPPSLK